MPGENFGGRPEDGLRGQRAEVEPQPGGLGPEDTTDAEATYIAGVLGPAVTGNFETPESPTPRVDARRVFAANTVILGLLSDDRDATG